MNLRAWIGERLRFAADRIDPDNAPRRTHWSFTFEDRRGARFRDDGRGCPLWYLGHADYDRAHNEADTRHTRVNWTDLTVDYPGGAGV